MSSSHVVAEGTGPQDIKTVEPTPVVARVIEDADSQPKTDDYLFMNGLRLVQPYFFDFQCNVKQRMEGKNVVEIVEYEFPTLTREYYLAAWAAGNLRIANAPGWPITRPLRTGQSLRHLVHRHEPPVLAGPIEVLGITDELVAVNKPACMPVHTVGQYRKNTVLGVLSAERPDLGSLMPTNRLDKPVSGVLLLARSPKAANSICALLQARTCHKVYVARVVGRFPASPPVVTVTAPILYDKHINMTYALDPATADPEKLKQARESVTDVSLLSVAPDGLTSMVEVRPKTGRTHQIRVHLLFLGHPVANDSQYGGTFGLPLFFKRLAVAAKTRDDLSAEARGRASVEASADAQTSPPAECIKRQRRDDGSACATQTVAADACRSPAPEETAGSTAARGGTDKSTRPTQAAPATCRPTEPEQAAGDPSACAGILSSAHPTHTATDSCHPSEVERTGTTSGTLAAATSRAQGDAQGEGGPSGREVGQSGQEEVGQSGQEEVEPSGREEAGQPPDASAAGKAWRVEQPAPADMGVRLLAHAGQAGGQREGQVEYDPVKVLQQFRLAEGKVESFCPHCPFLLPQDYPTELEPLWLHARHYSGAGGTSGTGWAFDAPLPQWAQADYVPPPPRIAKSS